MSETVDLEAIREAMNPATGQGLDVETARAMADLYVAEHPDQFTELATKTLAECVRAIDVFRSAGMADEQWKVETWLLHHYESQSIGGAAAPTVRIPANG